jgi:hypothetical protein
MPQTAQIPEAALAAAADGLEFTESRPLGGTWARWTGCGGCWGSAR